MAARRADRIRQSRQPQQGHVPEAQYQRLRGRRGEKAQSPTAHSILVAAWHILSQDVPYQDLGEDYFARRQTEHADCYRRRLIHQLERLGHTATLEPIPGAA